MANWVTGQEHYNYKHGLRKTKAFGVWWQMHQRCRNPNVKAYPRYGGRGITVCDRWKDFANFLADMGHPPDGLSLDRIDNDGNYEPGNCRWATRATQSQNSSLAKLTYEQALEIRYDWEAAFISEAAMCEKYGVSINAILAVVSGRTWRDAAAQVNKEFDEIERLERAGLLYCLPEEVAVVGHA